MSWAQDPPRFGSSGLSVQLCPEPTPYSLLWGERTKRLREGGWEGLFWSWNIFKQSQITLTFKAVFVFLLPPRTNQLMMMPWGPGMGESTASRVYLLLEKKKIPCLTSAWFILDLVSGTANTGSCKGQSGDTFFSGLFLTA